jgi:hypothetical protein
MKDVQATGETSVSQKEHPVHQNNALIHYFLLLWVIFTHLDPDRDPDKQNQFMPSGSTTLPETEKILEAGCSLIHKSCQREGHYPGHLFAPHCISTAYSALFFFPHSDSA